MTRRGIITLLSFLLCSVPAFALSGDILPLSEVEKGMKGYGETVFEGNRIERFDVEVLGVLRNIGPGQNLILAKVDSPLLRHSGVIAGMSGSPIYIDGRIIGALAYSWQFSKDPIAGITPIEDMLRLEAAPAGGSGAGAASIDAAELISALADRSYAELFDTIVGKQAPRSFAAPAGASPVAIPLSFAGFSGETIARFSPMLDRRGFIPVAAGSSAAAGKAKGSGSFKPGDPVAGVLLHGDFSVAATGTVTWVDGEKVYGFGHPFLDMGPVSFPMAEAEIVAIMPNLARSFKFSNTGAIVGRFMQDRAAGIFGRIGSEAEMIPVTVAVDGSLGRKEYHFEVVRDTQLFPVLLAMAADSIVSTTQRAAGQRTVMLDSTIEIDGYPPIRLKDGWAGTQARQSIPAYLAVVASYLVSNEFQNAPVREVHISLRDDDRIRTAKLIDASVVPTDDGIVNPGDTVQLRTVLKPFRGDAFVETFDVRVPEGMPAGRAYLFIGSGSDANRLDFSLVPPDPQNLGQVLHVIERLRASTDLTVALYSASEGAVVSGVYLPDLPASMQSIVRSGVRGSAPAAVRLHAPDRLVRPLDFIVEGAMKIDLDIRPRS